MAHLVLVLTGQISSGKSTLANGLADRFGFSVFKTKEELDRLGRNLTHFDIAERGNMQEFGESLDVKTNGTWVRDALLDLLASLGPNGRVVVDAARISQQIEAIRFAIPERVIHIHIHAPQDRKSTRL